MNEVLTRFRGRIDESLATARRTTPGPLLVRAGVFLAGLLGQLLAWPFELVAGPVFLVLLGIAVVAPLYVSGRYLLASLAGLALMGLIVGYLARLVGRR